MTVELRALIGAFALWLVIWGFGRLFQFLLLPQLRAPKWLCIICLVLGPSQRLNAFATIFQVFAYEMLISLVIGSLFIVDRWRLIFVLPLVCALMILTPFVVSKLLR